VVYPENMLKNLNLMGGFTTPAVLLKLATAGASRERAYELVQRNAMKVWTEQKDLMEELLADPEVGHCSPKRRSARL